MEHPDLRFCEHLGTAAVAIRQVGGDGSRRAHSLNSDSCALHAEVHGHADALDVLLHDCRRAIQGATMLPQGLSETPVCQYIAATKDNRRNTTWASANTDKAGRTLALQAQVRAPLPARSEALALEWAHRHRDCQHIKKPTYYVNNCRVRLTSVRTH